MGATCCGVRGDYEIPIDTDKNKDEIEIIKTIKEFDWNNKNPYKCTIEEIIMCSIANDTGDLINPQSSHILFSEFKKFMFLNAMYIKEGVKDKTVESKVFNRAAADRVAYLGLIAPPILDLVWCILLRTKIYEEFCQKIFKGFLDRSAFTSAKDTEKHSYHTTIKYLKKYGGLLTPFWNIWPDYDDANRAFDRISYITTTLSDIDNIFTKVKEKIGKDSSTKVDEWKKITKEIIDDHSKSHIDKEEKPKAFSTDKIKLGTKEMTYKNLYAEIEMRDFKSSVTKAQLQERYMIDSGTAKCWIKEYYKFMIMLIKDATAYFPSWKVQAVLNTHAENSEHFRHFCYEIFGHLIYPEDYNVHFNSDVALQKKYENTITNYKSLYGAFPNPNLWEAVESRFAKQEAKEDESEEVKSECNTSTTISFSLFRYVAVNQLILSSHDPFNSKKIEDFPKTECENQITETNKIKKERDGESKKNSLYGWRAFYPHCSNLYVDTKIKLKETDCITNPYANSKLKQGIFNCGGVAFLINPFSSSDLTKEGYLDNLFKGFYKEAKMEVSADLNLDDIADAAFRNPYLCKAAAKV